VVVPELSLRDCLTREQMREATRDRWRSWQQALDEEVYRSQAELARAVGVSRAAVSKGLGKLG